MVYRIAWMKGDGIGEEISEVALEAVKAIEDATKLRFDISFYDIGDACKERRGEALPQETVSGIKSADAAIKGPVGETAAETIIKLRQTLDLYANLRPVRNYAGVPCVRPMDILIVRENTEDLYKGWEFPTEGAVISLRLISALASRRVARVAADYARARKGKITIVHKANVMKMSDGLFRRAAREEIERAGNITVDEMYVDAMSMALIRNPEDYDVILTTNMFGDILSDEAAQVAGGLGFAPSANVGERVALFEPAHGSAPDIAGKGIANPYSMVLSLGMMIYWLGSKRADAEALKVSGIIDEAVGKMTGEGFLTRDAGGTRSSQEIGNKLKSSLVELLER